MSLNTNDHLELRYTLLSFCRLRKYRSKSDVWIGFGSIRNSSNMVDGIVFNNQKWVYDESLEKDVKKYLENTKQGMFMKIGGKIGRNDKCPCGSGLKYKKCCGAN